jgi:predicted DNA-binding protein
MEWQTFRLSREDKAKLKAMADKAGMTVSEIMRDMIRTGNENRAVHAALEEIRALVRNMAVQKGGTGHNEDLSEIRRIVTLMARAMPAVAKHVQ